MPEKEGLDMPEDEGLLCSSETQKEPKNPKAIYPSLEEILGKKKHLLFRPSESGLDFAFQADLEEEAAKYEEERYGHGPQMSQISPWKYRTYKRLWERGQLAQRNSPIKKKA